MSKFVAGVPFIEICKNSGEAMCFNTATKYKHDGNTIVFEALQYEKDFFEKLDFAEKITARVRFKEFESENGDYDYGKCVGDKVEEYDVCCVSGPIVSNCNLSKKSLCTYIIKTREE